MYINYIGINDTFIIDKEIIYKKNPKIFGGY